MCTDLTPPSPSDSPSLSAIVQLLQPFTGNQFRYLLAFLRDPEQSHAAVAKAVGVTPESAYNWRYEVPGFKDAMETIRASRRALRSEYAKLAFDGAIPDLVDAMIQRGKGQGVAAQRAGERILEAQGVLPKANAEVNQAPIQVHTHTYLLVQPGQEPQPFMVETTARELPAIEAPVTKDAKSTLT